jgi:hypothetical protein
MRQQTGRLTFAEITALIDWRPNIRFKRLCGGDGWFEFTGVGFGVALCRYRDSVHGPCYMGLARISDKDKLKKDWLILQDLETGLIPDLEAK